MQSPKMPPDLPSKISEMRKNIDKSSTDRFGSLPLEIIEAIAIELPTRDALNSRYASRAMLPIFASKAFWRTRFEINGERGFLHLVVRNITKGKNGKEIDWRLLYHCTCKLKCGLEFEFSIRVWESLRWLRDAILAKRSKRRVQGKNCLHLQHSMPLHFRGRALLYYHNSCYANTHVESVEINRSLRRISISAVQINAAVYIIGIEFVFDNQPSVLIGYKIIGAKIINRDAMDHENKSQYKYPGIQFETDISHLRGFTMEHACDGVRMIKIMQGRNFEDYVGYRGRYNEHEESHEPDLCLDEVKKVVGIFDVSSRSIFHLQEHNLTHC